MYPYPDERDTAEIRLLRAIHDLNYRIAHTPSEADRTNLRSCIVTLRSELLKLIESLPIVSEDEVQRLRSGMGHSLAPMTARGCS